MMFKKIPDFDCYEVSECGLVKSKERYVKTKGNGLRIHKERILKQRVDLSGYITVNLTNKDGYKRPHSVHRLVAMAFHPRQNYEELQVNHKDGNKQNNHYKNLEWVSAKENIVHAIENSLRGNSKGSKNGASKLKENDVKTIRDLWESGKKSQSEIANNYNITVSAVSLIVRRKLWKHI